MFALGHPEKIIDFGYRALHETTAKAKAIIAALYDKGPKYSYYNGCSTGGRQGLVEATRYPEDFDGIVAGAPANPQIYLHASGIELNMQLRKNPELPLTPGKVAAVQKAVMQTCDKLDGVKDGILNNPEKCTFDPSTLLCKEGNADTCLTAPQVEAVKRVFADVKTTKGETVWTGFALGSDLQSTPLTAKNDPNAPPSPFLLDSIRILGYQDPNWDWRTWNLDRDLAATTEKAGYIDIRTYDLSAFKARAKTCRTRSSGRFHHDSRARRSSSSPRVKNRYASRVSWVSSRCRSSAVTSRAMSRVHASNQCGPEGPAVCVFAR